MDVNIIVVGIISGVALILGIKNWSRNGKNTKQGNLLNNEIHTLKEDVKKLKNSILSVEEQNNLLKNEITTIKKGVKIKVKTVEEPIEYLSRIRQNEAISKPEFNNLLEYWYNNSNKDRITEIDVIGVTPWIFIKDGERTYRLHADTRREGVEEYLNNYKNSDWVIVENNVGNLNAVAFSTNETPIRAIGLNLYLVQ